MIDLVELVLVEVRAELVLARADSRSWLKGFSTTIRAPSVRPAPASPLTTMPNSAGEISR